MAANPFNTNPSYDRDHLKNISYQLDVLIKLTYNNFSHHHNVTCEKIYDEYIKNTEKK